MDSTNNDDGVCAGQTEQRQIKQGGIEFAVNLWTTKKNIAANVKSPSNTDKIMTQDEMTLKNDTDRGYGQRLKRKR